MLDYNKADTLANMGSVKREEYTGSARSAALIGGDAKNGKGSEEPEKRATKSSKNVVAAEMKTKETKDRYERLFSKVNEAVYAAREACQKRKEGVESEKEMDALAEEVLTDLIAVIERIRDERKELIAARTPEEQDHAILLP